MELALGGLYSEEAIANGIDHHMGDLIFASIPYAILHTLQVPAYEEMARRDADLYERLERPASCSTSARTGRVCS